MTRLLRASHVFLAVFFILGSSLADAAEIEVRGTILRLSGEPLPGVRIHLMAEFSRYDLAQAALRGEIRPTPLATTVTDARGRYRLVAPNAGVFRVLAEAEGCFFVTAGPMALTGFTELAPIVPPAASRVRVRVLDADSRPVAGAWVNVRGPAERRFARELPKPWNLAPRTARTGVDGWASLPQLPGEKLEILAFHSRATEAREEANTETTLRLSRETSFLEIVATGTDGQPLSDVLVQVGQGGWTVARTGADGRTGIAAASGTPLRIRLLAPDGRRIGMDLPPLPTGTTTSHKLTLPALQTLTGTTRRADGLSPLAGAFVWSSEEPGLWTVTDRKGQYRLAMPSAVRSFRVEAAGYLARQTRLTEADVRRGRAPTLALRPAAILVGKALDESGAALEGIAVAALPEGVPPGISSSAVAAWGFSDQAGRFELRGLMSGEPYRIQGVQTGLFGMPQTVIAPSPGGAPPALRLVLSSSQGIRGRVLDSAGQPIFDAEVLLRATQPPKRSDLQPIEPPRPEEEPHRVRTDHRGAFTIRDLPALEVDLIARKSGFASTVVRGLKIRPGKVPMSTGDIVLRPGVRLVGRVVDRAGRPVAGAAVHAVQQIDNLDRLEARLRESQPIAISAGDGGFVIHDQIPGAPSNFVISAQGFAPAGLRGVRAPLAEPVVVRLEPTAVVRGRVVDKEDAGIRGARVFLEWQSILPENPRIRIGEVVTRTAIADQEGRFELRGVPAGVARISVSADGFVASDPLSVEIPQDPKKECTVVLQRGAILEGRISTKQDVPIGGARVIIANAMALSDDDGRYLVAGVPLGEVEVEVSHSDYPRWVRQLKVENGPNVLDIQFEAGHRMTGVVLSAAREPVPGAFVTLETIDQGRGRRAYHAHTSAAGTFELSVVADGDYRIKVAADGFAEEKRTEVITVRGEDRNDLEVVLGRGASIAGRVLGLPQDELPWVEVSAQSDDADAESTSVRLDPEGRFMLRQLPLGNWQIRARHPQRQRSVEARAVLRTHGEEAIRDLRFGGGSKLSGKVVFAEEPLPGALVSLRAQNRSIERSVVTDYQGEFQLEDLDAYRYHLSVTDRKTLALHSEEIVLDGDQEIEVHLRARTVAGSVLDSSSRAPVARALLSLKPVSGADFMIAGSSEQDGSFVLPRVPEGRYRLSTKADGYTPSEQEVEVAGAEVTGLEIKLAPTQGLDLVVRLASGQPPAMVHLRATSAASGVLAETRTVGADGRVRLATLPAGEWDLWIAAPGAASLRRPVRVPGQTLVVDLPLAGRLSVRVPELAESPLVASVAVVGSSQQPFSTLTLGGEISSNWPLVAGSAFIENLPAGAWTLQVKSPDGRTWTKAVTTTGTEGEVSFE